MKKRIISMLLVVVMVLAMFPTAFAADAEEPVYEAVGENLFLNGGFELVGADGKPQNTATGGMGDQQVWGTNWALETNPENVYEGNNSLLASTQSWTMIYPKHSVMYPGVTYQISYKIKGTFIAEGRDKEFGLNFLYNGGMNDVSCGGDVVYAKEDEWTTYTAVFTVPEDAGATGSIGLHLAWGQGTVYLDDFQCYVMEEVGDPTEPDPVPDPDGVNLFANGNIETLGEDGNPTDIGLGTSGGASGWGNNAWLETENVYEGKYAIKLVNNVNLSRAQFDAQVEPFTNYIFSFKAKGTVDAGAKVGALVYAHSADSTNYEKTYEGENIKVNEDDWTTLTYKINSESYTTLQFLVGSMWAASTLYIDDVRLEVDTTPVDPDAPVEQIDMGDVYNNKVFYYPGATDGGAEVKFVAKYDVARNYTVDAALKDGDTVLWSQEDLEVVDHVATFEYDTSLMTEKKHAYTTEVTVRNANGQVVSVITEDCYIYDPPTVFNENGEYVEEDGTIFNPVFAFWGPDQWEELEDLAAAGVNCVLWTIPSDEEEALRQLDDLYAMGMKANVVMFWGMQPTGHPSNKDRVQTSMEWIKDHPAIYCWNVADEPYATADPPAGSTVRDLMIESYKVIREVDTKYPVTYVDADYTQYKHADDYVDFVMIDPYPGAQSFASWIGDKAAILAEYTDRPFAVIQQSFGFAGYEPYAHELHSMMYQAYLAGAQYQGYYGIGHGTPHLEAHPTLWPVIKGFYESGEWEVLFKQYSSGKNPTVASNRTGNVWYDVFQLDGDYFAILQNRTFQNQTVNIDLDFDVETLHVMTWSDDVSVTASATETGITATLTSAQAFMLKLTGDPYEFTPANPELPPQPEKPEIDSEGNLITNGSFETLGESSGNPTGVAPGQSGGNPQWGSTHFVNTDPEFVYEGSNSLKMVNADGSTWAYIQMEAPQIEPGYNYTFSFKVKGTSGGNKIGSLIYAHGPSGSNYSFENAVTGEAVVPNMDEWTTLTYKFNSGSYTSMQFLVGGFWFANELYIDDVQLVKDPGQEAPDEPDPEDPTAGLVAIGDNLASNGDVEYVTDGQANDIRPTDADWTNGIVEVSTDAYEGNYAIRLNSDGVGQDYVQFKGRNMEGGKWYEVRFMMKGDIKTENGRDATFFIDTEAYNDNNGHSIGEFYKGLCTVAVDGSNVFTPTSEWTECVYRFQLKEGCVAVNLSVSIMGPSGYILVDNVSIREVGVKEPTYIYGENKASNSGIEYVTDDGTRLSANDINAKEGWTSGIVEVTTDAYEGEYALKLNSDGDGQDFFQIKGRNMEGGKVYQVDFMLKGDIQTANGRDATFFVDTECYTDNEGHAQSAYWGGLAPVVVDGSNVFTPTSEWTACSYQFTLKEGCCATALSFSIMGPTGYIIVDNVTIREVIEGEPEPDVPDEPEVTGNLFANGGFETLGEDGNPTDVALGGLGSTTPAWGTTAWLETDPANVYEGSNSVKMQAFGGLEFMELDSAVEPETDYVFSFKVKGALEEASNYVHPMIYAHGPSGDDWAFEGKCEGQSVIPSDEWQTVTYKFNSADYTSMDFLICANWFKGIYYVDDVQLVKASEYEPEEPTPDEPDEPVYTPDPANLIVNGSFEELEENGRPVSVSTKYGYPLNEGWGMEYSIVSGEGNVVSGNYAVKIVDEGKAIRMGMAPVEAKPNTTYVFSYKVKGTGGPMGVRLDASGAEFWPASSAWITPNADEWTTMTYVYENVSATVLNFEITANWKAMDVIIDDVCLYEVGTENLFLNGGFEKLAENGKPLDTATGGMGDQQVWGTNWAIETNPENVYEGSNSLLASTQSWTMIYPKHVDVEPGATYMVSYKLKGTFIADGADKVFGLNFLYDGGMKDISCGGEGIYAKADEWTTYNAMFTVPEDAASIYGIGLHLAWGQGTVYLDDFQMYKVGVTEETEPDEPEVTYGNNVMKNGSFEELNGAGKPVNMSMDVDIPAWDGWETTHFLVTGDGFTTDGNYALKISESNGAWARTVMKADIEPNRSYLLTLDIKGTSAAPFGALIYAYGSANGTNWDLGIPAENQVSPKADEWTTLEYVFENTDYTSLEFLFGCTWNSLDVIIDNVQLREIGGTATEPEPEEPADPDVLPEIPHESTNYVVNGSFEDLDDAGKPIGMGFNGWGESSSLVTDPEYVTDGNNAVKIELAENGWSYANLRANVEPNTQYVLYIDGRGTSNLKIGADIEFWRNDSGNVETAHIQHTDTGDFTKKVNPDSWTTMYWVFTTPAECHMMEIAVSIPWTTGTLYVDNIRVYRLANNFAENGSFESVEDGKAVGINVSSGWTGDNIAIETAEENVYEGSNSLKISSTDGGHTWAQVPARNLTPGATYQVSFWMKGELSRTDGKIPTFGYDLEQYTDNNGHNKAEFWGGLGKGASFPVTDEWQYCVEYFTLPDDIVAVNLTMGIIGATGTVYFDDVRIQKYEDAAMGELLNERVFYYPEDETGFAELTFPEAYAVAENYVLDIALTDGSLVLAEEKDVEIVDNYAIFNYDLSLLTKKEHAYTVIATLTDADGDVVSTMQEDIYIYDRPTALNENGEYVEEDGSIFNPVYAFWGPDQWDELDDLAAAGVNTILWTIPSTTEQALQQLDDLHAHGMKANVVMFWDMEPTGHPVNAERVIAKMEAIKDHPAIYAWNVADEPYATANPPEGMTVRDLMIESYKVIRSVDKKYPVTYVEADYREYAQADDYADIIIIDPYPGTSSFASHVGDRTALITSKVERPVAVLHQSFSFAGCKPTDYELHSMIYQGYLAGGAQMGHYGIGGAGQLEHDEELWPVIQGIYESGEWDVLFKQYSSGKNPTVLSSRTSDVWLDVFEQDGVLYAAVQNRTYDSQIVDIVDLGVNITAVEAITWGDDVAVDAAVIENGITVTLTEAQAVLLKLTAGEPAPDLVITEQPATAAVKVGEIASFTVVAEGEGLTYEWFYKAVGSDQWQKSYSVGYNTDTLRVEMKAYRNGQEYKCVVSDAYGQTVESDAVAMTVAVSAFSITSQPVDFEGAENAMATFTVAAEGDGLTYRWQYSNDGGVTWQNSWSDGYATDTLNVELKAYRDGQQYRCVVTDATGAQLISDAAALVLKVPTIEITAQPESETKAMYETVTFTVEAEFGEETLKYRWYRSNDGGETWVETWLDGYDTNELSFVVNGPRAATPYKCKIYAKGITVWTDPVTVTIAD